MRSYEEALQISIEYQDHYAQASTYHQLGMIAQEQREWEQAREHFLQALIIFLDFDEHHSTATAIKNLARLWRTSNDTNLIARLASVLEMTPEEAMSLLQKALDALPEQPEA